MGEVYSKEEAQEEPTMGRDSGGDCAVAPLAVVIWIPEPKGMVGVEVALAGIAITRPDCKSALPLLLRSIY